MERRGDLRVGGYRYEHTEALFDGRVAIAGASATFASAPLVTDVFRGMVEGAYDVAELGLTYFLRAWDAGAEPPFLALPVFPNRNFRHSAVYVNTAAGIERPEDLAGRTVGEFALYGHDAGVWPKGILADEYGVDPASCRWVVGGTNHPVPPLDWIPQPVPEGVEVRHAGADDTLGTMLESGEIDALISVDVPEAVLRGSPRVRRLFPDHGAVEREYFARTGIFPMMHVIAVTREVADDPDLLRALHEAYDRAKGVVQQRYRDDALKQHMSVVTPWFSELFAADRALLGEDWWPYGLARNRVALDTFLRYHHEQGLSRHRLRSEDVLVPELIDT